MALSKLQRRTRIRKRIRKIIEGTAERPRLSVYRSNKEIYAQLIDDKKGETIIGVSSLKNDELKNIPKIEQASKLGQELAQKAQEKGVSEVVFDRNGYLYHGRVKAFAEAAREGGLKF